MISSLRHFRQTNGVFPDRVMIYRDGVGDGQLDIVRDQEIKNVTAAFEQIGAGYRPKLTGWDKDDFNFFVFLSNHTYSTYSVICIATYYVLDNYSIYFCT